jgi:hypothetical protein
LLIKVGAYVASTLEEMEWNVQGKGITYRTFYFTGHRFVGKFMTGFRIDGRTIKRGKHYKKIPLHMTVYFGHRQAKMRHS